MKTVTVVFEDALHHVCLMYGVKRAFEKMPFLNRKILEVGGKIVTMDNIVAPPPMMRNPEKASRGRKIGNLIEVSYWKNKLSVKYQEEMCGQEEITAFVECLIQDYLHFRHPYMKVGIADGRCTEGSSGHLIADILTAD